jgi:CPA2 family monovalent cation:H+ antiporter-2
MSSCVSVHDLPLLVTLSVALAYALAGGLIARKLGLPTLVGYMVAGIALGPFTPGYHGDTGAIAQMAEFGVILLMFGVGLHFSFNDLWRVRQVAIPGALLQMLIVTVGGYLLARGWDFSTGGAWIFGLAISVASTVVLMRGLMDQGWLDTPQGRVAVGWLVFEDLLTVAILVLLPMVAAPAGRDPWTTGGIAIGKALLFIALMVFAGARVVPAILSRVVNTRSRELFVLVALTMAAGTALASAQFFGLSLALGAFVAGVVVGESEFSQQISADLLPFREAFAVVFFVSVGMLIDPIYVADHWGRVIAVSLVIIVGKGLISGLLGAILPCPARTALVLAAGRAQIGEFSFIVGQSGLALGLIDQPQYSLILSGALVSITANTFLIRLVEPAERAFQKWPRFWRFLNHGQVGLDGVAHGMSDHVVIVGSGRVGRHIAEALGRLQIPRLVVEADPAVLSRLHQLGVPALYGDAGSSEILEHASIDKARALVITLPDDAAVLAVVVTARLVNPKVPIVARASTWDGGRQIKKAGANEVVRPELEGGIEIVRRTLLDLELPVRDVQRYVEIVRNEGLDDVERPSAERARVLDHLIGASKDLQIEWLELGASSPLVNRTIDQAQIRSRSGASIVAISRADRLMTNPEPGETLLAGDRLALIGTPEQVGKVEKLTE